MSGVLPRYPVYVPTKGRASTPLTLRMLLTDGVPFWAVVEPQEVEAYASIVGEEQLLVLPESDQGVIYARNWIKAHATEAGHERHWQLDDNISTCYRMYQGHRLPCAAGPALRVVEDLADRYENVALAGLDYEMFVFRGDPPVVRNIHVYSCTLVLNAIPHRWRLPLNEDTDLCLQVLADGWCTLLVSAFMVKKHTTMTVKGGNTGNYQGDGRLRMARGLERVWPGVVRVERRYGRPQHVIEGNWRRFDTPLKLKPGVDLEALAAQPNEYGMQLETVKPVKSPQLRQVQEDYAKLAGQA